LKHFKLHCIGLHQETGGLPRLVAFKIYRNLLERQSSQFTNGDAIDSGDGHN